MVVAVVVGPPAALQFEVVVVVETVVVFPFAPAALLLEPQVLVAALKQELNVPIAESETRERVIPRDVPRPTLEYFICDDIISRRLIGF